MPVDIVLAAVSVLGFVAISLPLAVIPRRKSAVPARPTLLYIGYTTLDQAREKGLLLTERSAQITYNPGDLLGAVTVLIPFGKRAHETRLAKNISFVEIALSRRIDMLPIAFQAWRFLRGLWASRRWALKHNVVMVGGPNMASFPGIYVRLTTSRRCVVFVEAFWEEILPFQRNMGRIQRSLWYRWYGFLYRVFDAYVGGPSFKPEFYVRRGMSHKRIWPYVHQVDVEHYTAVGLVAELPKWITDLPHPWIITVGRLEQEKLSIDCVRVAELLAASGSDFTMIMIGEGSERANLTQQIELKGLKNRLVLTGALPNEQVFAIAKQAELCLAPYMGSALVEVMLAGSAVVAYDNDPHRGIAGGSPVKFVRHACPDEAADAIRHLLDAQMTLTSLRVATKEYAWNKWSMDNISNSYIAPLIGTGTAVH